MRDNLVATVAVAMLDLGILFMLPYCTVWPACSHALYHMVQQRCVCQMHVWFVPTPSELSVLLG